MFLRLDMAKKSVEKYIKYAKNNDKFKSRGYQELADIEVLRGHLNQAKKLYEKARDMGDPNGIAKTTLDEFPKIVKQVKQQPIKSSFSFL